MSDQFSITITPEQFGRLSQQLVSQGTLQPGATSGSLPETQGVQLDFAVTDQQPDAVTIEFIIMKKPFFATTGMIKAHVEVMIPV